MVEVQSPNHLKEIREAASGIMWLYQCAYFRFDHFLTFLITTIRLVEIKSFQKLQSKNNRSNQEISISPIWKHNIIEERKEKEKNKKWDISYQNMFSCGWFSWNSDRMDILDNTEFGLSF